MKLSEVKGERVFDVVADVIEPIVSIATDKDAAELFQPKAKPEDMTPWEFFLSRIRTALPALLRSHKDDLVLILSTINDIDPERYKEELTLASLLEDVTELLTDRDFMSFFG